MKLDQQDIFKTARHVLDVEHKALALSRKSLDEGFFKAVQACAQTKGRVVVLGIGKSGLIGRKIAATLASTGTPSSTKRRTPENTRSSTSSEQIRVTCFSPG